MYDQYGATEEQASGPSGSHPGFGSGTAGFDPSELFKNIFTGGGARNPFGQAGFDIFGTGMGNGNGSFGQADLDVSVNMSLSFLEAAKGSNKSITFQRLEPCTTCTGSGVAKGSKMATCKTCRGKGQETTTRGSFLFSTTCRACGGLGQINPDPCGGCGGLGAMRKSATVEVAVPSGVSEGEALSLRREGNRVGNSKGDLIITFSIEKSDVFTRKRNDIYVTTPLSLYQALVGGAVEVATIDGPVELKIPPGTQPDDTKRMSGRGINNATTGEHGNQYVRFRIDIPKGLTPEQQELLSQALNPNRRSASDTPRSSSTKDTMDPAESQWFDRLRRWWKKWY